MSMIEKPFGGSVPESLITDFDAARTDVGLKMKNALAAAMLAFIKAEWVDRVAFYRAVCAEYGNGSLNDEDESEGAAAKVKRETQAPPKPGRRRKAGA